MASEFPELPDVSFLETDPQEIIENIITGYEQAAGYTLADGDPRRLFLLSIAYIIVQQRQDIDSTGKNNLLYYANDDYLDHLGAFRNTPRLPAAPAVTTLRFILSAAQGSNIGVPQGTRATSDNQVYFKTTAPATIISGQTFVDVPAEAITAGVVGNGYEVGEISRLVDPIPFVQTVQNTTSSSGGREKESNDAYRLRIYNAPISFSVAGPSDAYKFLALSASSSIVDVSAFSPSPGVVEVRPLLEDGGIPSESILELVDDALSPKTVRPLTDNVNVLAPNVANYDIELTYYIRTQDNASVADIQARVNEAIDDYQTWQREKLGRDINPDQIISRLIEAGVKRASITSPVFTAVPLSSVALADTISVNYGGLEDE